MDEAYIVLIEDNPDDAFLAARIIGKISHDRLLVARDGEEATEILTRMRDDESYRHIRLVFLDLKLPKINGLEILQFVRTDDKLRNLPVAILTSSDNETDQEKAWELGVLDYIYKPLTADRLKRLLQLKEVA